MVQVKAVQVKAALSARTGHHLCELRDNAMMVRVDQHLRTAGKGGVFAANAVEMRGKGSVLP